MWQNMSVRTSRGSKRIKDCSMIKEMDVFVEGLMGCQFRNIKFGGWLRRRCFVGRFSIPPHCRLQFVIEIRMRHSCWNTH